MSKNLNHSELNQLFKLVEEYCTTEQIKGLLRSANVTEPRSVRVSAENKDVLVTRNLRQALADGKVALSGVQDLVRDAEENGRQHVFLYRLKKGEKIDPEQVAARLFAAKDREAFPLFLEEPVGERWADFRILEDRRGKGFTAKLYRGDKRFRLVERNATPTRITKTWELKYVRGVILVRLSPGGILEIRVPRFDSRKEVQAELNAAWAAIGKAMPKQQFEPWMLSPVATKMSQSKDGFGGQFVPGAAVLEDHSQGTAIIMPRSSDDALNDDDVRSKVVKAYDKCRHLVVNWMPTKATQAIQEELRTVIGTVAQNEFLVAAKSTAEAMNHVIGKLDEFDA